jgi:Ice-binding-like
MCSDHVGPKVSSMGSRMGIIGCPVSYVLAAFVALAMAFAGPSTCSAQTINLGQGSYGVFEESNGTAKGGTFTLSGASSILGNVELGSGTSFSDTGASIYTGSKMSPVSGVSTTLHATTTTNYASGISVTSGSSKTITGVAGVNVYNITGSLNVTGAGALTISGPATGIYVFNVSNGVSLSGASSIIFKGGASAMDVVFNVTGGNVSVTGASNASGTFVDQNGTITVSGASSVTGALVSEGNITVSGASHVTADPFVAVAVAPELSTIVTASFAFILVLGSAGIRRLRR